MAMSPVSGRFRTFTLISTQRIFLAGATKMNHAPNAIQAAQQTTPDLPGPQLRSEATQAPTCLGRVQGNAMIAFCRSLSGHGVINIPDLSIGNH